MTIAFFAWVSSTAHMIGEFFRDAAVLLVIFVPLDLWKPGTAANWLQLSLATVVLMGVGMVCEYVAVFANRFKCDLQEGGDHGSK